MASPCPAARFRLEPNSGRRLELDSGELRPSLPLPLAPEDADELWLLARGLRRPNGHRRTKSEASAAFGLAGVESLAGLTPLTMGLTSPGSLTSGARPLLILVKY